MCGENTDPGRSHVQPTGSSPRVRGKRGGTDFGNHRVGLIPACAGKTCSVPRKSSTPRAHPRVCGENHPVYRRPSPHWGSSPRVRGKLGHTVLGDVAQRLIPACAGKTLGTRNRLTQNEAHPRVCGENSGVFAISLCRAGSSPRVRGKLNHGEAASREDGLIPACAGKTR